MTAREMEKRLLEMQEEFGSTPTGEQRAEYLALFLKWCEARGVPAPAYAIKPRPAA